MFELQNTVLNDILCFISKTLPQVNVIAETVGFYDVGDIQKVEDAIFKICNEKPVTRKSCSSHPNPSVPVVEDILNLLHGMGSESFFVLRFCSGNLCILRPSSGFDAMTSVIGSLRDKPSTVGEELRQMRENSLKDTKAMENVVRVKEDIKVINLMMVGCQNNQKNNPRIQMQLL